MLFLFLAKADKLGATKEGAKSMMKKWKERMQEIREKGFKTVWMVMILGNVCTGGNSMPTSDHIPLEE